jgi:hypothetical protein
MAALSLSCSGYSNYKDVKSFQKELYDHLNLDGLKAVVVFYFHRAASSLADQEMS